MAKATPGITIKLGSLHALPALPALPANKLYQHVLSFKETLKDASTFDAWHNALLLTARCYKGIFDGTIVETYGDVNPGTLLAAHSAAERTLMGSLGTLVKSHLTAYNAVPELYKQLVTRYGVTGIARELEIYASYNVGLTSVATSYTPYHPQVCVAQTTRDFVWDGGSEIHVTNNCDLFLSYQDEPLPDVSFGRHLVPAKGKGTVDFRRPDGTSFSVNNVWFTPSGHVNALTPNQFLGLGYKQGRTNNEGGSLYQPDGTVLLNFVRKPNLLLPVVDAKPERGSRT
ncbi:hypothetical protein ACM66B_006966 [Microbotryomycetes sp. NB124-2]